MIELLHHGDEMTKHREAIDRLTDHRPWPEPKPEFARLIYAERLERLMELLTPYLVISDTTKSPESPVYSPAVAIEGSYEGKNYKVLLRFKLSRYNDALSSQIGLPGDDPKDFKYLDGEDMNPGLAKSLDESNRDDWYEMDELERSSQVFLDAVGNMTPDQLIQLGIPGVHVQLSIPVEA